MYKLNNVNYASKEEAAEAVDQYLSILIEDQQKYEKEFQNIIDNAKIDPSDLEAMETDFMKKLIGILKKSYAKKIAKTEMKQQRILDKKDFDVLLKDVDKSIKLYPKAKGKIVQSIETFKNTNDAYQIEICKIMLELAQKTIEDLKKQKELNATFLEREQEM